MTKLILATTSPYRIEAFRFLGLDFVAEGSNVDEHFGGRPNNPEELVLQLAKLKAEAVARNHSEGIIIGFDSVGWFNGKILEKPKSREEAFNRLKSLSGNTHLFNTSVYMINIQTKQILSRIVKTKIFMRKLTDSEINKYLDQDSNFKTYALGYDPLGNYSSTFVIGIEGSYNNLTRGIPLEAIVEMLPSIGYSL